MASKLDQSDFGFNSMTVNLFNIFVTILVHITHREKQYPIHGNISFYFWQNYVWIFMPYMQVSGVMSFPWL